MNLDLTKNTPGYSAPVAARTFAYLSVGMYESSVQLMVDNQSLSQQLNGFTRNYFPSSSKISYQHVANLLDYDLALYFFDNMPPFNRKKVDQQFKDIFNTYKKQYSKKELKNAEVFAKALVSEIVNWAEADGTKNPWNANFPKSYIPPICEGCWVRTQPGFVDALQPFWGANRLMVASSGNVCEDIPYLPFSKDSTSEFYAQNKRILSLFQDLSQTKIDIAKYWDDAPGITGTPVGHLFNIGLQLAKLKDLSLAKSTELFVLLGVAINDAMRETWKLKYHYNLIRPYSYIQRYISKKFETIIVTPPFPEFPSGHSFQSGAGSEVLKYIFTDAMSFTDSTNQLRTDMNGAPRTFKNFTEMSEQMSISRFYGGIHYENTLRVSLIYGRKIGSNTIQSIQFLKQQ